MMGDFMEDDRFSHIAKDPKFRRIPKQIKKFKIDDRFKSILKDGFGVKYTVDKRGKPQQKSTSSDLKKYYEISSEDDEEEDEDAKAGKADVDGPEVSEDEDENVSLKGKLNMLDRDIDYARGEAILSDSSLDEESSQSEDENEENLVHEWGELDKDVEGAEKISKRLAVCNMNWDRIHAHDLMVLFNSFLPSEGLIKRVTIYPSEYGLNRMREEDVKGPLELVEETLETNDSEDGDDLEENDDGSDFHMEKLRKYQLNRLKYFYAVVEFDSEQTANHVYTECDGLEYESSASKLDLRFIPDDMEFEHKPKEICDSLPEFSKYKPLSFTTTALQQATVRLTWDETPPARQEMSQKLMTANADEVDEEDIRNYLACSSEGEDSEIEDSKGNVDTDKMADESETKEDPISKYKALLKEIEEEEEKKKMKDIQMEVTWGIGLKDKAQELVDRKLKEKLKLTPFEEMMEKKKEKRRQKKKERKEMKRSESQENPEDSGTNQAFSDDELPSDVDINDSYFKEEMKNGKDSSNSKKNKKRKKHKHELEDTEENRSKQAELELLLDDDDEDGRKHFSYKAIVEEESELKKGTKRKKWKRKAKTVENEDDFKVNVLDPRFAALYSSASYNIDPADPHYHETKAMEAFKIEKINRRNLEGDELELNNKEKKKKVSRDTELSMLMKKVKSKLAR